MDRFEADGLRPTQIKWLGLDETDELVARWREDHALGTGGSLCFAPGGRPAVRRTVRVREPEDVSAIPRVRPHVEGEEVVILFQDYHRTGAALIPLGYLCTHMVSLAQTEGNGVVVVRKDDQGFMTIDHDEEPGIVDIELWGTFLSCINFDPDD